MTDKKDPKPGMDLMIVILDQPMDPWIRKAGAKILGHSLKTENKGAVTSVLPCFSMIDFVFE